MNKLDEITKRMPSELNAFYRQKIGFIKQSIKDYFPEKIDTPFIERVTGQPTLYRPDIEGIYETIFQPTQDYLDRGGKVLRPILVALCLEAYGASIEDFKPVFGAIEVMEDSSIMMDDYIDNSLTRRGGPCGHIAYGYPLANISSCTAFALSHYLFYNNELELSEEKALLLLDRMAWEHIQMAFGQIEELYWTQSNVADITVEQYLQETVARCAFLTFRGPMRYAGILADAPADDIKILERIGEYLLVGYHLKGDNLDMSPDSPEWGKVAGEDITTGRRTLLINFLLQSATPEERETVETIIRSRTDDEEKKKLIYQLVLKYDIFSRTKKLAAEYNMLARREIEKLSISDEYKRLFQQFTDYATENRSL
ncbi:MAG: hypothetical protein CSA26_07140 [Desulfobacterales bacterium]|nr:MAG: hypothetical protein CSA26_07140 [Desulfobacterales bacterium]